MAASESADGSVFTPTPQLRELADSLDKAGFCAKSPWPCLHVLGSPGDPSQADTPQLPWKQALSEEDLPEALPNECAPYRAKIAFLVKRDGVPNPSQITVGRSAASDLVIGVSSVSKLHAYFVQDEDGWRICDPGSTNGTYVNAQRIQTGRQEPVEDGALVSFGPDISCIFMTPETLYRLLKGTPRMDTLLN